MKILTITCHDVYNAGASLQAYALAEYLKKSGNEVQIINYKPDYLRHYRLWGVQNPAYDKPVLKEVYQLLKFPGRVKAHFSRKKRVFDDFTASCLPITKKEFHSAEELRAYPPEADLYIAGSDQIWNPLFPNGKDPAFFLDFVPENKRSVSYAASFAVSGMSGTDRQMMRKYLKRLDAISVRESSGVTLLHQMDLDGIQVCDPVFLLSRDDWLEVEDPCNISKEPYLLLYDFDGNAATQSLAEKIAFERNLKIISVFPTRCEDIVLEDMGPKQFLSAIHQSEFVLSNSFHATAFSIIFRRDFLVTNRQEKINARMLDLLSLVGLESRYTGLSKDADPIQAEDWAAAETRLSLMIKRSIDFLNTQIRLSAH